MKAANITESKENYLRTILHIKQTRGTVRAIDIAVEMNVSRPSVSRALHILKQEDYIRLDNNRYISFTPCGLALATNIQERYDIFYNFFLSLGISEDMASLDAGRMEHAVSNETFELFKERVT